MISSRELPSKSAKPAVRTPAKARASGVPPIVQETIRSPGQPLDHAARTFFEPRFGHDFSRVRVHTDAKAAESAKAVNARAYTVGDHMVLDRESTAAQMKTT